MILNQDNYLDFDLRNKVIVFPTDTVYGIGCLYTDKESISRIYEIKGRDYDKPMVILCSSLEQVNKLIKENQKIPNKLKKHWPGKLTIIFFKNENIYDILKVAEVRMYREKLKEGKSMRNGLIIALENTLLKKSNEVKECRGM